MLAYTTGGVHHAINRHPLSSRVLYFAMLMILVPPSVSLTPEEDDSDGYLSKKRNQAFPTSTQLPLSSQRTELEDE